MCLPLPGKAIKLSFSTSPKQQQNNKKILDVTNLLPLKLKSPNLLRKCFRDMIASMFLTSLFIFIGV